MGTHLLFFSSNLSKARAMKHVLPQRMLQYQIKLGLLLIQNSKMHQRNQWLRSFCVLKKNQILLAWIPKCITLFIPHEKNHTLPSVWTWQSHDSLLSAKINHCSTGFWNLEYRDFKWLLCNLELTLSLCFI